METQDQKSYFLKLLSSIAQDFKLGHFYNPDGKVFPASKKTILLPYDRLLFILDGKKIEPMSLNGEYQKITLLPGDYYLVRKNIWEYASRMEAHTLFYIMLRGGFVRLARHTIHHAGDPWDDPFLFHTAASSDSLTKAFSLLKTLNRSEDAELLVRLIARLTIQEIQRGGSCAGKAQITFENIRDYVEMHYMEPITRESIAKHFGLSKAYISQIFQKFTNHAFQDYVTECRINNAQFLLTNTRLELKEIADHCGFVSYIYFVRRFRECTGIPPGHYRIQHAEKIQEL